MRILPGAPADISGQSITQYSLTQAAIANPDVLPRVWQVFAEEESPLSGILAAEGLTSRGLFDGMSSGRYRVVGSNHVIYPIKNSDERKVHTVGVFTGGKAYNCPAYPTEPGKNQSVVEIAVDSNWARPNEVFEMDDNITQFFIYDDDEPREYTDSSTGKTAWIYKCKLRTGELSDYADTELFTEGAEMGVVSVLYEQEFSETGSEKYTYDGWGHAYMTLQRVKMSWSGTVEHLNLDKSWYQFQNSRGQSVSSYLDYAEKLMWKRAASYHEYEAIFGKGSVTVDGDVILKNKKGREIMAGDGLVHQGEGAYEYPYNKWTMKYLESLLRDAYIRSGKDGKQKVALIGGWENTVGFSRLMAENGFKTMNNNVVGEGEEKGVVNDYSYYEIGGVRIIVKKYRWFDSQARPNKYLSDGTSKGSWDGILVPLGMTDEGEKSVELIQLRPPVQGTVNGMNKGGEMATSVDGAHRHLLVQSGIISRVKIQRMFRPYKS